ncbi:MAG: flocculation-associated PEP-CTERM protein PepA [Pseudomonadota bacterium]
MKFLKKLSCAAALALSFANAHAAVNSKVMNDWVFNPNGGGFEAGQSINEYLDVNGNAFIQLTPTSTNSFSFVEHAVFNIVQADSNAQLFPQNYAGGNISAVFTASGTGTFNGAFSFTGGTISIYQNSVNQYGTAAGIYGANLGIEIAKFNVLAGGGGLVDATGKPTGNGQVSVLASADVGALKAGYFFDSKGNDLSTESVLSFAFTNANNVANPSARLVSELVCEFSGFTGNGCKKGTTYANNPGKYFLFSNNGQFKLATEVPEPGSLALFGIAMLGAGVVARKRANKA